MHHRVCLRPGHALARDPGRGRRTPRTLSAVTVSAGASDPAPPKEQEEPWGQRAQPRGRPQALGQAAVLIPVKSFADAKTRLGDVMADDARQAFVRRMAERVLAACAPLPVAVVCDDPAVAAWARPRGALVIWEPGRGLNGAVEAGVERLGQMGVGQVTVAHGDLPLVWFKLHCPEAR